MTEAPEKIWADCFPYGTAKRTQFHAGTNKVIPLFSRTEYTRSDIANTLRADLARLRAVADVMAARFEFTMNLLVNETPEGIRYPDGLAALAAYHKEIKP
jgi:hypothetical protein